MLYLDRIYTKPTLCVGKGIFDVKKQLQFEREQKLWKEVKDDTAKYEETITKLKRKGQIRKIKQISH